MSLSPNCGPRRGGARPDMVVIHYTAMASTEAARERLCDPAAEVSAHWLISERGEVLALVPEDLRAWHAGAGAWGAVTDVNSRSIGIELANLGDRPFPEPQMAALERLLESILARWQLAPERVIAHSDMAPERKCDPGPRFDWRRLALAGLSVWPEEREPADFHASLRAFGYPEAAHEALLQAFRLRFRPWARGPQDATDAALAADLAARFPVDAPGAAA
ncbi:N-acetylmuramoyl-L-alanine amidase [Cereibacter sphaeroides]|uniref:N-acetylmuramoyl-L-alanine amidase n=1 Tax=Cereibacter sphaeroides TaxID=1063 RepID=UPI001F24621F|nr:N-acetylmuramoyl-L-alanine amidase [Cereibacter sphaeroides]MCE6961362.1 N-acetylmuramoyl-L-alanine amidase [Cereibacter sphaeroides]MCE6970348.1 N-acetylmuramoyl-L-alanine amidase [Cereibacter sphaeroides]MCE6973957.1 N-acetylmuramoyl-L-alanine amidase [Cereibacter sphaeroides]